MDFKTSIYCSLILSLKKKGYSFQTFEDFILNPLEKSVILRHDVDSRPSNSLITAQIEQSLGVVGSYYFRIVKESNIPEIIRKIAELGHEVGYHYETMDSASSKLKNENSESIIDLAYQEFCKNLEYFRTFYPVKTICMHGSPLSKYDNKEIWKKYSYKSLGLIGEPYFDIDFSKVLYLTDTGRCWDGEKVSVRDKVQKSDIKSQTSDKISVNSQLSTVNYSFRHTKEIIKAVDEGILPKQIMITVHPQRWTDNFFEWIEELVMQNLKNIIKRFIVKRNTRKDRKS